MSLEIEIFGGLVPKHQRRQTLEAEGPMLIRDVMNKLEIKEVEVGLITVDGVQSELDEFVRPGSRLCFFPYMSGG
jgi:hypothetical protein